MPLLGQEAVARQATVFAGEYNIIIWLNEHRIKMIPNYLFIKENSKSLSSLPKFFLYETTFSFFFYDYHIL